MNEKGEDVISEAKTTTEDENTWVFESLVGFLSGLVWSIPITNFMETKCHEFDPLIEDNEKEHERIYGEYKQMVDLLLSCFMQDIAITAEQFEKACYYNTNTKASLICKSLFDQIWAAEDYETFVRVMTQKNTELQLQALLAIADSEAGSVADSYEDKELQRALWKSFEEHQETVVQQKREKNEIQKVLASTLEEERKRLEAVNHRERELLEKAIALSIEDCNKLSTRQDDLHTESDSHSKPEQVRPSSCTPEMNLSIDRQTSDDNMVKPESSHISHTLQNPSKDSISEEEVVNRRAYLNQQRQKLLEQKHQERKKRLVDLQDASRERPKSARVAIDILQNIEHTSNLDVALLSARRALAARLKSEVVTGGK